MFKIAIITDNDAFMEGKTEEVVRILERLVKDIRQGKQPSRLLDYNGNTCGKVSWD